MNLTVITDLTAIARNIDIVKSQISAKILFMVKSEAYGHGLKEVAKYTQTLVDYFGVATVDEGAALRLSGIKIPILVTAFDADEADEAVALNLICSVYSVSQIRSLQRAAESQGKFCRIHVKIDTGMNRLGVCGADELAEIFNELDFAPSLICEGAYSHLAGSGKDIIEKQKKEADRMFALIKAKYPKAIKHIAASSLVFDENMQYDMVRLGLTAYGYGDNAELLPSLRCYGKVKAIKTVKAGEGIGYGWQYVADKDMTIAIVSGGYGDGINPKQKQVLVSGEKRPVVGTVCMDMLAVDVSELDITTGGRVTFLGVEGREQLWADGIAAQADTISYQILTGYHGRISRLFLR